MLKKYADTVESAIRDSALVSTYAVSTVQLSPNTGYVEGEVTFVNASRLVFFTFLRQSQADWGIEKYRYHFMDADNQLIFRYDNAPHHPTVASFPHHKHLSHQIVDSPEPDITLVIAEAEAHVLGIS